MRRLGKIAHNATPETIGDLLDAGPMPASRQTYGADPGPNAPRYISACHTQSWRLLTWSRTDEAAPVVSRIARCCSWRHEGPCARQKAAEDYSRIKAALAKHPREHVVYAVLTIDPSAWDGHGWRGFEEQRKRRQNAREDESAIASAYSALTDRWRMFGKLLREEYGAFAYVSTVESTKAGWPHLNVILVSEDIARDTRVAHDGLLDWDQKARGREVADIVLGDYMERSGFGCIGFLEPAQSIAEGGEDRLAAYIAKLAATNGQAWDGQQRGLLDGLGKVSSIDNATIAEISKLSQVPHKAPPNFRRLRSSKGFLPPLQRNPDTTGVLLDGAGCRVGKDRADVLLAAAEIASPEETQEILAAIGNEFAKLDMRERYDGEHGKTAKNQTRRILRKMIVAARICLGGSRDEFGAETAEIEANVDRLALKFWCWRRRNPTTQMVINQAFFDDLDGIF